ncbi:MAG: pilus assembly protein [Planctomycetota bacterium]|nr:pilus assembly protein [Planctomycetota bacterium]
MRRSKIKHDNSNCPVSPEAATPTLNARKRRRGFLSAELIFTLPILAIVLFGLFEFSMLFFARGQVAEAARIGCRKATLPGVQAVDVEETISNALPARLRRSLRVRVDSGVRSGDVVTVSLAVDMQACSPDLLWPIGYSLRNRQIYHTTRMIRE